MKDAQGGEGRDNSCSWVAFLSGLTLCACLARKESGEANGQVIPRAVSRPGRLRLLERFIGYRRSGPRNPTSDENICCCNTLKKKTEDFLAI